MIEPDRGNFELKKFAHRKEAYREGLQAILEMGYAPADLIHQFPAFAGHLTIARFLCLYEAYKMTAGVAGHIAEVGVYMGAGSLLFAKLTQLFEPNTLTQVHGFDWFQGATITEEEKFVEQGECLESEARLLRLIRAQQLENTVFVHNLDVRAELDGFFERHPHLHFKLVFLDCGLYDVVAASLRCLWPRLVKGGVLLLDHFNHEVAPGETRAVREFLPDAEVRTFPYGWMPTAYIVKT